MTDQFQTGGYTQQPFNQPAAQYPAPAQNVFVPTGQKKAPAKYLIFGGVLILIFGIVLIGYGKARSFLSGAESICAPSNMQEKNLTANSVEITFSTEKVCQAEIAYGTSPEAMLLRIPEEIAALNHSFKLSPLLPSTTYYYQVLVDSKKVGVSRSFLTKLAQGVSSPGLEEGGEAIVPTNPPSPTPTKAFAFTLEDFEENYGGTNPNFDIDKNGIVNSYDWLLYQKEHTN